MGSDMIGRQNDGQLEENVVFYKSYFQMSQVQPCFDGVHICPLYNADKLAGENDRQQKKI